MKKLLFMLLCTFLCSVAQAAIEYAYISGTISGYDGKTIHLSRVEEKIKVYGTSKIENGKFNLKVYVDKPGYYLLFVSNQYKYEIYVEPNMKTILKLGDDKNFEGDYSDANEMIIEAQKKFNEVEPTLEKFVCYDASRAKKFQSVYVEMVTMVKKSAMSDSDKVVANGYFQTKLIDKLFSGISDAKVSGHSEYKIEVKPEYCSSINDIKFNHCVVGHQKWFSSMEEYIYSRMENGSLKIKDPVLWLNDAVKLFKDEQLKEEFILALLKKDARRGHIYRINDRIAAIRPLIKSEAGIKALEELNPNIDRNTTMFAKCNTGTYVGDYSFNDVNGDKVSLKDFMGNYIYIDIWGTGCGPCIAEIPYLEHLEHDFEGKPVKWVSIVTDGGRETWLKFMKNRNMEGIQLISPNAHRDIFFRDLALQGIPRFLIIDKECKIVDPFSYRPSNPILKLQIEALLKK